MLRITKRSERNNRRTNRRGSERRGAQVVEFTLAFPALMLLTFFCFDMARLSMMRNLAHNAAYETARFAMMEGVIQAEAKQVGQDVLARLGTQGATIDINDGEALSGDSNTVDVTVTVPVGPNALVMDQVMGLLGFTQSWGDEEIVSEISMRKERYDGFFDPDDV